MIGMIGEHVKPTGRFTPWITISSKPKMIATGAAIAEEVEPQHWTGPVLHCDWEIGVGVGPWVTVTVVVAAARIGRARREEAEMNFIAQSCVMVV